MKIILDGLGGDFAPQEPVKGAVAAAAELPNHEIVIVGPVEVIQEELDKCKFKGDNISIREANDVITMEDSPVRAIRRKTDSTLVVISRLLFRLIKMQPRLVYAGIVLNRYCLFKSRSIPHWHRHLRQ